MKPAAVTSGVHGARAMALFGDSITTDHISPAGSIKEASPAKPYETEYGTQPGVTSAFIESIYKSLTAKK